MTQLRCRTQTAEYKDTYFYILTCSLVLSYHIWTDTGRHFTGRWVGGSSFQLHWPGVPIRLFLKMKDVLTSHQPPIQITFLMQTGELKFTVLGDLTCLGFSEVAQVKLPPKFYFASITCLDLHTIVVKRWYLPCARHLYIPCRTLTFWTRKTSSVSTWENSWAILCISDHLSQARTE